MTTIVEALERIDQLFEGGWWCQGNFMKEGFAVRSGTKLGSCYCIAGAARKIMADDLVIPYDDVDFVSAHTRTGRAVRRISRELSEELHEVGFPYVKPVSDRHGHYGVIVNFNDDKNTTFEMVQTLVKRTLARLKALPEDQHYDLYNVRIGEML